MELRQSRATAVVLVAVVVTALVAACGGGEGDATGDAGPPAITHDEANQEYRDEAAKWELPEGWHWPDGPTYNGKGPDGAEAVYEPNIGRVDASHYWFCAWSRTFLSAGSEAERERALERVLRLSETPFYQLGLLPQGRESFDAKLAAAESGDFQDLTATTDANCPEVTAG